MSEHPNITVINRMTAAVFLPRCRRWAHQRQSGRGAAQAAENDKSTTGARRPGAR